MGAGGRQHTRAVNAIPRDKTIPAGLEWENAMATTGFSGDFRLAGNEMIQLSISRDRRSVPRRRIAVKTAVLDSI
jgi:hypothetical protein